jgi:hypothetical protein
MREPRPLAWIHPDFEGHRVVGRDVSYIMYGEYEIILKV